MMIKTEKLSMLFTTEEVQTKALNEINLQVEQGEFLAIMGPSGCGKSTLLNILGNIRLSQFRLLLFCKDSEWTR